MISEISKAENPRPTINHIVLDTSSFIRQKAFDSKDNTKYYTTEYIIKEIKDEKAREYYELNKSLIEIRNPSRDTIKLGIYFY
jgi:rRNA maturation endonuclease Nob1